MWNDAEPNHIDKYDVPLDKAYQNDYYNEMVTLIRAMFGDALKTNEYLQNEGREDIMLYGVAFCKKRCRVKVEKL